MKVSFLIVYRAMWFTTRLIDLQGCMETTYVLTSDIDEQVAPVTSRRQNDCSSGPPAAVVLVVRTSSGFRIGR